MYIYLNDVIVITSNQKSVGNHASKIDRLTILYRVIDWRRRRGRENTIKNVDGKTYIIIDCTQ